MPRASGIAADRMVTKNKRRTYAQDAEDCIPFGILYLHFTVDSLFYEKERVTA